MKTMDRRSLPTDTALSSVRHKIKSFENLANFDKPVAKSSDIHSYALAYRASLHQRIAGYMGVVNSIDCRSRQRSFTSYVENLMPTTRCCPLLTTSPSSITLTNLELPRSSCSAVPPAEGLRASDGAGPLTPQVLRRKHGRLPLGSLRQLRAISMPDLDQLCTEDFGSDRGAAVETTERGGAAVLQTATEAQSSPAPADRTNVDVTRDSGGDVGSTEDPPQGTPETPGQPPGWAISFKELASSPGSQSALLSLLTSPGLQSYASALLQEAQALSQVNGNTHLVVLSKEEGSGLGFSVAGGVDLEQKAITVHRVFSKGPASLEGRIQRGDSVLSVNGTSLGGKTHSEVFSCLHQARLSTQALVVIWRDEDGELDEKSSGAGTDGASAVELHKSSAGLGFSLEGGKASSQGGRRSPSNASSKEAPQSCPG